MFLYYLFYISLDSYCLRWSTVRWSKKPKRFTTQNIVECCFFCCFVFNKCHKVIPHNVITWSFFFLSLSFSRVSFLFSSAFFIRMRDSLELAQYFSFHFSFSVYLEILHVSWVPRICTYHMEYVRFHGTKELMKNHIFRDATTEPPFDPPKISFNRIVYFFVYCFWRKKNSFSIYWKQHSPKTEISSTHSSTRNSTGVCAFLLHFIEICLALDNISFLI